MMKKSKIAASLALAVLGTSTLAGMSMANNSLFGMSEISHPVQIANDHHCGSGSCGSEHKCGGDHKCGSDHHCGSGHEHKDGEAKCGGDHKCGSDHHCGSEHEHKDGEHKCGSH